MGEDVEKLLPEAIRAIMEPSSAIKACFDTIEGGIPPEVGEELKKMLEED